MPSPNCTGCALLATPLSPATACWALFAAALREVSAVLFPVAGKAKRFAVADYKAKVWKFSPMLNVMRMQFTCSAAAHALVSVPTKDGRRPFSPLWHKARAFIFKRLTSLPSCRERTSFGFTRALARAIDRLLVVGQKLSFAVRAGSRWWRFSRRPASLGAPARIGPIWKCEKLISAPLARSAHLRLGCGHMDFLSSDFLPLGRGRLANARSCASVIEKLRPMRSPSLPCRQYRRTRLSSTPSSRAASAVVYLFAILLRNLNDACFPSVSTRDFSRSFCVGFISGVVFAVRPAVPFLNVANPNLNLPLHRFAPLRGLGLNDRSSGVLRISVQPRQSLRLASASLLYPVRSLPCRRGCM
jgi:hypothetical protein